MKIHTTTVSKPIIIESVIRFTPWPFKDACVTLDSTVLWWDCDEGLSGFSDHGTEFTLFEDDCDVLITLSDGRTVITDNRAILESDFTARLEKALNP